MTSTEGVTLQVDDVYVPLGLVERKKQPKPQGDISPEQGSELYKETEITKTFEHDAFLEEVLKQKNTPKSQGKRIAIIGEPGAGKTTLLQQIANWVSREIPQSIVIWVSLADLRGKELKSYLLETWLTQVAEKVDKAEATKQLKENFVALFKQDNVWLLLDGLDEMSASNPLTEIARQFREAGLISQARIVLTCRVNLWDGSINALDDFDTYRSLDFSYPEQVEKFIHRWFAAIPETGKQLCTALKESGKERIQDLVKNPLRLTLLCLNWQSGDGKLPDTQAGLYQQFVNDFYKWKKEEFATTSDQHQQLNIKLGELAKAAIDKEATRFRLRQDFVSRFLGDAEDEKSLLKLALNHGWLNRVGIDTNRKPVYAFFHASFQEYFAAKAINDWHFFLNHVPNTPNQGTYRIFEPRWKQTILLWLGREEENLKWQKQQFINALVSFKDRCGKRNREDIDKGFYEYRAYFLAAAGIAEFKGSYRDNEIVAQIVKWSFGYLDKKKEWSSFPKAIEEEARSTLQKINRTKAIAALLQLLQSKNVKNYTRWQVAESLGKIGKGNEIAITALLQLLQSNNVDNGIRWQAAESLGKIGIGNEKAIATLLQLLQSKNVDDLTRSLAAHSLGQINPGDEIAIAVLLQLVRSKNVAVLTRSLAAHSLGQIDPGNEFAIAALVQLLQSNNLDDDTRSQVVYSLGQIDPGNEIAIAALVQVLQSPDVDKYTRMSAASSLGKIDPGNKEAIAALLQLLQSKSVGDFTRSLAPDSLGQIATGNENAIAALMELLQSTTVDDYTRRLAASSLGKIGIGNENAIAALIQLLQSKSVDDLTRWQAAKSLGQIGAGNEKAIAALVKLLQSNNLDDSTCQRVAESLEKIDPGNENAITALVKLLQSKNVKNYTRRQAAESLGKIGTGNGKAITALMLVVLLNHVDDDTRSQAAFSLGKILQDNKYFFEAVKTLSGYRRLYGDNYDLAWECAQNMPYSKFYQAWHQHDITTRTMQSLKQILFRII
ncbi:HEAT repeat domain-containing protein [Nostoc sp. PCC 7120 = FACHB-418]|uniref:HEAT repeat domain-containing protein n=1 Tax=Anabaena cylindrica FACHB-318 TaxID=2692880 RepID=A0ABR7ZED4_ANACY|nr:HEAT repeat domain-containing protein [Anabaena cylindrica FACHB-318]MBD2262796.1 HEAT repeat domain-containing protein [Anabaena sp. FACHB-709]MBD2272406.1 HEAT repeat domain-containing protein [Nostoc sp. PCC 7120 = FACHB-418]MBD2283395.1 HEAT repeat domain-containing protein [Anabaena cylindrica FACHB-170]MBD2348173.1 HEAT repeat domain-containing protein [Trichormus variabilis FACHB-171]HBW30054.1 NACHT domain-containing protein [Nostoc sp. UBA8866]